MKTSVIICTRNRHDIITDCIKTLSESDLSNTEIIIVDQSTDSKTKELIENTHDFRYIYDSGKGLSKARNIGIRESTGEILAFTDDDCVPAPDWISNIISAFDSDSEMHALYGRSLPWNDVKHGERPIAIKEDIEMKSYSGKCNPWKLGHGNNMAFRFHVFKSIGLFDEALGPGSIFRNCDDADFTYRVLKAGFKAVYSPTPIVYHKQFRHGNDLWHLEKDYDIGAGAMCSKHLRCGDLYAIYLIIYRWFFAGFRHILYGTLTAKPVHVRLGWYRMVYLLLGIWMSRIASINTEVQLFENIIQQEIII